MHQPLRLYALVPDGFTVMTAVHDVATTTITVRCPKDFDVCPSCGAISRRVHSHYHRRVSDLPLSGRRVKLLVVTRRFRCDAVLCGRQIFAELFADKALAPWARRTARLDHIIHHLGLALGGRPAARFSQRLRLPVSKDTLLRMVRRRARVPSDRLKVIGIDDWARRRNHSYGTIVCDLERHRPVTLLPDREPATAAAWFEQHQEITIIARDRGGGYGEAAAKALPHATQVADRWHLNLQRIPSARTIARLMTIGRHVLSKAEAVTIAAIESGVPLLVEARELIAAFQAMVRNKIDNELAAWIARASSSLVASFASGVAKDEAAVRAAISLPWSNGQTEGQITKLKLVKRQMYGRAKIDLLQARLIGAI